MSSETPGQTWQSSARGVLRWLPGLLVTVVAFWFLLRTINWQDFWHTLITIPIGTLVLVVVIYLISMLARAAGWQMLLQRKVSYYRAVMALNEGYFINNILPLRLGELGRAVLLGRHSKLGMFYVLSTIVMERSFDLAIASGLLLVTLPLVLNMDWARPIAMALLAVILFGMVMLYMAARYQTWLIEHLQRWFIRWPFINRWAIPPLRSLLEGFSVLNSPIFFALGFFFLLMTWFLAILRDWTLLQSLSFGAPFWWAVLAVSASNLGGALPSAAASLGVFEAAAVAALALVGMTHEAALAYALIVHVVHLIFSSLIGGYALSQEGESLAQIYADLRSVKSSEP